MMSYLHTKFHDNWISRFRGVAMTRFWTDGGTDGWSDCTPRPAFAFGDAGKNTEWWMWTIICNKAEFIFPFLSQPMIEMWFTGHYRHFNNQEIKKKKMSIKDIILLSIKYTVWVENLVGTYVISALSVRSFSSLKLCFANKMSRLVKLCFKV